MQVLQAILKFFKAKSLGFYFTVAATLLSFVQMIVYVVAFSHPEWVSYMHWTVTFFSCLGIVLGIVLSIFKLTAPWAPAAVTAGAFVSFIMFILHGYLYFPGMFYNGVTLELIFKIYGGFLFSLIAYILIFVIGIVAMFLRQNKKPKTEIVADAKEVSA